jgi:hypothetical protein
MGNCEDHPRLVCSMTILRDGLLLPFSFPAATSKMSTHRWIPSGNRWKSRTRSARLSARHTTWGSISTRTSSRTSWQSWKISNCRKDWLAPKESRCIPLCRTGSLRLDVIGRSVSSYFTMRLNYPASSLFDRACFGGTRRGGHAPSASSRDGFLSHLRDPAHSFLSPCYDHLPCDLTRGRIATSLWDICTFTVSLLTRCNNPLTNGRVFHMYTYRCSSHKHDKAELSTASNLKAPAHY